MEDTIKAQNEEINRLSVNMEDAIQNAMECSRIAQSCLQHCLSLGGKHADVEHISVMMECAEITRLSAQFMISTSDFTHDQCGVCARVCDACFESCDSIDPEDPHLNSCMVACRKCADSCRNMEH
jgi:hypothetical protein